MTQKILGSSLFFPISADGIPTSVDFLRTEVAPNHMVVGFRSGTCAVYDLECGKPVVHMDTSQQV